MKRLSLCVLFLLFSSNHAEAARFRPFGGIFSGAFSGSGVGTSNAHVDPLPPSDGDLTEEKKFVEMINKVRIKSGMKPLIIDPVLSNKARGWAKFSQRTWSHKQGESEIMTRGGSSASYAFSSWRGSESHWNMLLRSDFRYIGIARSGNHWCGRFRGNSHTPEIAKQEEQTLHE